MIAEAIGLALVAAVLHAIWNVRLKGMGDPLRVAARAAGASALAFTPIAAVAWPLAGRPGVPPAAWVLVTLSSFGHLAYFIFLSAAYRRGAISLVYPLARGAAPLLAAFAGFALGERLSGHGYVGVACLLAGIWAVRGPAGAGAATGFALLTAATIAAYSAVDSVGVRQMPPWLYGWAIWTGAALLLAAWVHLQDRLAPPPATADEDPALPGDTTRPAAALIMGVMMALPYLLVLIALSFAPLLVVAPVRESAVVLVTLWSVARLGERERAQLRIAGAATVLCGIALVVA